MKFTRHLLFICALALAYVAHARVVINELMQSNIDCIMDDLNDFPDSWVELYNDSDAAVSLQGYRLSPSADDRGYALPNATLAAHGYQLVYCDKEGSKWHTDFRLESGKNCEVCLKNAQGVMVDRVLISKKQPAPNIAYGRVTDASDEYGYQLLPTPGQANCGAVSDQLLPDPVFSIPGQVFTSNTPKTIAISLPADAPADAVIRYTTDGSEPTENSSQYSESVSIHQTIAIRAKLFHPQYLSSRSVTASYIFLGREMTLPVVSIVTDQRYWDDPQIGIYTVGPDVNHPNYQNNWRRPINLEFFDQPLSQAALNQLCETRIQGGASRATALKSLALYANKRFGTKRFAYEFFPDQRPGQTDYKSLILRNAGNDFDYLYMRDAIIQRSMAHHADLDWQAWRPAIVFINGVYKGIENIRERSNEDNIYTNYQGLEDITLVENYWGDVKCGSWDQWNQFRNFYSEHGHTLEQLDSVYDTQEFINLMILDLFYCNLDFPANNLAMWRPMANGGRWRFIAKDTDFGLGLYDLPANYEVMQWLYTPGYDPSNDWGNASDGTRMFRRAMDNEDFRNMFVQRAAIYIGDFLHFEAVWPLWEQMYHTIQTEYPIHRALYNKWWPNYNEELRKAQNWLRQRPKYFLKQLAKQYQLPNIITMDVNPNMADETLAQLQVRLCDVPVPSSKWTGQFFAGQTIRLDVDDADGHPLYWQVRIYQNATNYIDHVLPAHSQISIPDQCISVQIKATYGTIDAIDETTQTVLNDKYLEHGQVIIRRGQHSYNILGQSH